MSAKVALSRDSFRPHVMTGKLTVEHIRFRYLEARNVPGKVFNGSKKHDKTLKDLNISSGKTGKIGRHFVAELLPEPEDLSDNALARFSAGSGCIARRSLCDFLCLCLDTGALGSAAVIPAQHTALATTECCLE